MDKLPSLKHEKRSPKSNNKKKPVKVVYISNPMKIKATPSEFRAVVQQLTGQYATTSPPPEQFTGESVLLPNKEASFTGGGGHDFRLHKSTTMDARFTTTTTGSISDVSNYEYGCCREDQVIMDDFITPQMLENFSPLLLPSDFESSS